MEINKIEIAVIEETIEQRIGGVHSVSTELQDLHLAMVGGGIGEVVCA